MDMKLEYVEDIIVEYEDDKPTGREFSQDEGVIEKILLGYLRILEFMLQLNKENKNGCVQKD